MDLLAASNLLVLCPVIAVVAGVVLVFLFGFKQPIQPKKFTLTSDSNKKSKKKDTKVRHIFRTTQSQVNKTIFIQQKPSTSGVAEKTSSSNESTKKERSTEVAAKKSPTKEANSKKVPIRQENVKSQTKSKVAVKSTKKEKVKPEILIAQKKPDDFDDGSWFTVPTKSEKKKTKLEDVTSSPKSESTRIEQSIVEKKNAKNSKQLKDQANKSKKEAEDAAATKVLKTVEKIISVPVITEVVPTPKSIVLNEEDKQTAEIIEKIHEAIVDVVIEPVVVQKEIVSKSISKKIVADREEKIDEIKPVETNVAFDELAGIFIESTF